MEAAVAAHPAQQLAVAAEGKIDELLLRIMPRRMVRHRRAATNIPPTLLIAATRSSAGDARSLAISPDSPSSLRIKRPCRRPTAMPTCARDHARLPLSVGTALRTSSIRDSSVADGVAALRSCTWTVVPSSLTRTALPR